MTLLVHVFVADLFTSHKNFNHIFKDTERIKTRQKKNEVLRSYTNICVGQNERSKVAPLQKENQVKLRSPNWRQHVCWEVQVSW